VKKLRTTVHYQFGGATNLPAGRQVSRGTRRTELGIPPRRECLNDELTIGINALPFYPQQPRTHRQPPRPARQCAPATRNRTHLQRCPAAAGILILQPESRRNGKGNPSLRRHLPRPGPGATGQAGVVDAGVGGCCRRLWERYGFPYWKIAGVFTRSIILSFSSTYVH
jgi:hypothetical protein